MREQQEHKSIWKRFLHGILVFAMWLLGGSRMENAVDMDSMTTTLMMKEQTKEQPQEEKRI